MQHPLPAFNTLYLTGVFWVLSDISQIYYMCPSVFINRKNDVNTAYIIEFIFGSGIHENSTMTCPGFKIEKKMLFQ